MTFWLQAVAQENPGGGTCAPYLDAATNGFCHNTHPIADLSPYFLRVIYIINPMIPHSKRPVCTRCSLYPNSAFVHLAASTNKDTSPRLPGSIAMKQLHKAVTIERQQTLRRNGRAGAFFPVPQIPFQAPENSAFLPFLLKWTVLDNN